MHNFFHRVVAYYINYVVEYKKENNTKIEEWKNDMLLKMLEESNEIGNLPKPKHYIVNVLASQFEKTSDYLFLDPEELTEVTDMGTPDDWKLLLTLQTTQNYIKGQMNFLAQVAQRKTFKSLVQAALMGGAGSAQAAKQVQELSGIMNQRDNNRIVVLHQIPRPQQPMNSLDSKGEAQ